MNRPADTALRFVHRGDGLNFEDVEHGVSLLLTKINRENAYYFNFQIDEKKFEVVAQRQRASNNLTWMVYRFIIIAPPLLVAAGTKIMKDDIEILVEALTSFNEYFGTGGFLVTVRFADKSLGNEEL